MPNDTMMQGRLPMQYTPDQPPSADTLAGKSLAELDAKYPGLYQAVSTLIEAGAVGIPTAGLAGPVGVMAGMTGGALGGALYGGAGGYEMATQKLRDARMTSQMPPMPQYPAQPGLEQQMPPPPEYMQGPPNMSGIVNALRGR